MTSFLRIARQPLYLLVLLVAVVTGLTIVWWLLPLGLLVYVVAVALAARDPQTVTTAQRTAMRTQLRSPRFRMLIDEIDRVQGEIQRSVAQSAGPLQRLLQGVSSQTNVLVDQAHTLAHKGETIEQYLATVNQYQLGADVDAANAQVTRTTDDYTLQQVRQTRDALADRKTNAEALATYLERIVAQLQNIAANLNNVLAESIRLRTADAVSADTATDQVAERLRDLNADMDAFQRVLDTALVQTGASA